MPMMRKWIAKLIRSTLGDGAWVTLGEWGGGGGVSGSLSVTGVNRPAESSTMVYGCLMARREAIGSVALRISDAAGNLVESGEVVDLLSKPNGAMTWAQYIRVLETYSTLYDAIAILPVRDGARVSELIPLNPGYLKAETGVHLPSGTPRAVKWLYRDPHTGEERAFDPDEIVVHQGFNPHAPLAALSPIGVLRRTLQAEIASREQNLALFKNDATPPIVLHTDKVITAEQADQVLDKWQARHGGFANRGRPGVLWGGLKAEKLGLSPAEMEYLEGLKFLRSDYYMVFRVAPSMVGEMTGETGLSQGSSTDAQKVAWWENVGLSELGLIASLHEAILGGATATGRSPMQKPHRTAFARARGVQGPPPANLSLWFDDNTIPALVKSRLAKIDQLEKVLRWGWRPDEAAEWLDLGLPPHPTNIGTLPIGIQPAADMAQVGTPAEEKTAAAEEPRALGLLAQIRAAVAGDEDRLAQKWQGVRKGLDQLLARLTKAAAAKWSRYFMEQRDRVLERLTQNRSAAMDLDLRSAYPSLRANRAEDLGDLVARLFPLSEENDALGKRMGAIWGQNVEAGWKSINAEAGLAPDANPFQIDDPVIRAAIERRQIQGTLVNDTTQEDLRGILRSAIDEGDTLTQLSDRIAGYYKDTIGASAARPLAAARTQVAGAVNDGRLAAAQEVGNLKKAWLHGGSAEPREAHLDAQERYMATPIPLDEKFRVNGYECDAPGDSSLPAGEVINCSCMVVFTE